MAALKTPDAIRIKAGPAPPRKARVHLPSGTRPVHLVPVKGFQPIPAGDEAETTTSLEIGKYTTYAPDSEDDDLRATVTNESSSGLHPIPEIPIEVVEVGFDADRVARPDPRREDVDTERRPRIHSAVHGLGERQPADDEPPTVTATAEVHTLRSPVSDSPAEHDPPTVTVDMRNEASAADSEVGTETQRRPPVNLAEVYGALETVPLAHAVVKFAIESVEARAAARAAGRPMPSPIPPPMPTPIYPTAPPRAPQAPLYMPAPLPPVDLQPDREPPARSIAVELAIGALTFVAVSAPAFWYFFLR